jgi:hypothetical protein
MDYFYHHIFIDTNDNKTIFINTLPTTIFIDVPEDDLKYSHIEGVLMKELI